MESARFTSRTLLHETPKTDEPFEGAAFAVTATAYINGTVATDGHTFAGTVATDGHTLSIFPIVDCDRAGRPVYRLTLSNPHVIADLRAALDAAEADILARAGTDTEAQFSLHPRSGTPRPVDPWASLPAAGANG